MKKEENSLMKITGVQGHQKGIQKVNSYTWGALVYVFIHNRSVVYGPQLTLVNAIIYVRGFYGGTLVCIRYSFILSLNQIHFDIYLIIDNPSTT